MARADSFDEARDRGVFGCTSPRKVGEELGIGQIENLLEPSKFVGTEVGDGRLDEGLEHRVELPHAPPRAPPEPCEVGAHPKHLYRRRSAIIFLISAIALPGFKSFGQACVQLRIVWQRYNRNASSRSSSRSPVISSRLSTIQR